MMRWQRGKSLGRRKEPILTFKVLAALLVYPERELVGSLAEMELVLDRERLLPRPVRERIGALIDELRSTDLMEAQAHYVSLFDQSRSLSLYLFEHIHGESRERGQAMDDLLMHYRAHGLELSSAELPDFLPLFLEFLSTQPAGEARRLLGEIVDIVALLRLRLERRGTAYAAPFGALEELSPRRPDAAAIRSEVRAEQRDDTAEALDESWRDEPVTFGPGTAGSTAAPANASAAASSRGGRRSEPVAEPVRWVESNARRGER